MNDKKETSQVERETKEEPSTLIVMEMVFNVLDRKIDRVLSGIKIIVGFIILLIFTLIIYFF